MRDYDDNTPLSELCKPLSAKVMPISSRFSVGGRVMDERTAISKQRRIAQNTRAGKAAHKKKK